MRMRPGSPLGMLTVAGHYSQSPTAFLDIGLNTPGNTGVLQVNGNAMLGGTLALICVDNCSFAVGDSILVLDATGALDGSFAAVTLDNFSTGTFDVVYDRTATEVRLLVTQGVTPAPKPTSALVLLGGLGLLCLLRRPVRPVDCERRRPSARTQATSGHNFRARG